jgi:uncharacterized protein (TIGR02246 family)
MLTRFWQSILPSATVTLCLSAPIAVGGAIMAISQPVAGAEISENTPAPSARHSEKEAHLAVEAFIVNYLERYNAKDAAGVAALYAEDGILVPPGPMVTGKANIEKAWRATFDAGRTGIRYDTQQVHAEGNVVWSIGQFSVMSPEENGTLQERRGNFVNIYVWDGDALKFRVHSFSFLPSPRPR